MMKVIGRLQQIVLPVVLHNANVAHPQNILLSVVTDGDFFLKTSE